MLGRTAGELFWMCRYLERCENTARLVDAGFRMSLTRSSAGQTEWNSVLETLDARHAFEARHGVPTVDKVTDFLIRDRSNPASVIEVYRLARDNARRTRTALTLELWEAINESWMALLELLKRPVTSAGVPELLSNIRRHSALVRGALFGTLLRNDIYCFCNIGQLIERADNMARILNVKYYALLPMAGSGGSPLNNVQWEMLLRSASAERAYHWTHQGEISPTSIANFLILDRQLPRSLAYCYQELTRQLDWLAGAYKDNGLPSQELATTLGQNLTGLTMTEILSAGLQPFITQFLRDNAKVASQIETDYRFYS